MKTMLMAFLMILCSSFVHAGSFTDNGNGTVTDNATGLTWQQCTAGSSGAGCAAGAASEYVWEDAISYCESLSLGGHEDWRLPNIKELYSLVDVTKSGPAIDTAYFPATPSVLYWSSTTYMSVVVAGEATVAHNVDFNSGNSGSRFKTGNSVYVRCMRGQ